MEIMKNSWLNYALIKQMIVNENKEINNIKRINALFYYLI